MIVVVVDAISTGVDLSLALIERGCLCIQVCSKVVYRQDNISFLKTLVVEAPQALDKAISEDFFDNVDMVVAGSEPGVTLADEIASKLSIPYANDSKTTELRRNKFKAQERLAEMDVRSIHQRLISEFSDVGKYDIQFPVVVKPINSGASDGVSLCLDDEAFEHSVMKNLGKTNILGHINSELLIQDYIEGVQYFVNTISWDGDVYTTDVWKTYRRKVPGAMFIFEGMKLCDPTSPEVKRLIEYNNRVLSELGLKFGAAHNEIIIDKHGPVLVESNARLMGASINDSAFKAAIDNTQVELLVDVYLNKGFGEDRRIYQMSKSLAEISLVFEKTGVLEAFSAKDSVCDLDSFYCLSGIPEIGSKVSKTNDTIGHAGFIYLVNDNPDQLDKDFNYVLDLVKKDQIYKILESKNKEQILC
ncbi:ATP-grasp domain-containing protein [Spartinivicinus poritis]|uniref:ATP-grasp domain-containing protein n=1 Tax=Spartinivicinus poritis TaxID=2994640 RepID=A0ABT5UAE2_9GAMM|nr:ATP-grasp domain-containing protein [Spartinivicinus sp. A2-2]MDE1462522.1 ATP-grasp domain-containing protein [Spartinivicinus sp. A2-2]